MGEIGEGIKRNILLVIKQVSQGSKKYNIGNITNNMDLILRYRMET